ncbi:hypothetical protein FISHEDRAFT_23389, partial [Fistulina hepatica ATCC 64428]
ALGDDGACTVRDSSKYYDLSKLSAKKDYIIKSPGGRDIVLNVCRSLSTEMWGLKVDREDQVGAMVRRDHGDFSIG